MAHLYQLIDIENIINYYNLEYLIETGTGFGETLYYTKKLNFRLIQSCEIEKLQYDELCEKFKESNIKLWNGDSTKTLELMINYIDSPALIFLDAHFPGTGYIRKEFKSDKYNINEILPLEKELEIISNWKHGKNSIIVVDDLRIYKSGNYEFGDWEDREKLFGCLNYSFLYNTLKNTHSYTETLKQQGAIIYNPLSKPYDNIS